MKETASLRLFVLAGRNGWWSITYLILFNKQVRKIMCWFKVSGWPILMLVKTWTEEEFGQMKGIIAALPLGTQKYYGRSDILLMNHQTNHECEPWKSPLKSAEFGLTREFSILRASQFHLFSFSIAFHSVAAPVMCVLGLGVLQGHGQPPLFLSRWLSNLLPLTAQSAVLGVAAGSADISAVL